MAFSDGQRTRITGAGRLRQLLTDTSKPIVAPGVYDGISARMALHTGFDALYMVCLAFLARYGLSVYGA